jgi:hypothetical protein
MTGMPGAMASSVSREPGSVAKTVAGTSASKRHHNKKGGPNGPPFIDSSRSTRRVQDAQKQTKIYRLNDNATPRTRLDADTRAAYDANCGKGSEDAETTADKGGSSPRRQSENNAEKLPAEAARCPKGQNTALVSGVDFLIKVAKVRQALHRQAVFVFFALDVHFQHMLGKPFTGALGLGTVCKSAIYDQCAING